MPRKKTAYQTETIDKITVVLTPWFIDYEKIKTEPHIDPHNRLTLHRFGAMVSLAVHWEWIDPAIDIPTNIARAIHELIKKGYIMFPDNVFTFSFILSQPGWFIMYVQQIEFAFDFLKDHVHISPEAVESGELVQYRDTGTYYTSDYHKGKRKSVGIIYDKAEKNARDNKPMKVQAKAHGQRIEFRLCRNNSDYVNLDNLKGPVNSVFNRYVDLLATIYHNFFMGSVEVEGKHNRHFNRVVEKAAEGHSRYRGDKLKRSEPLPPNFGMKGEDKGKRQMQKMIRGAFLREMREPRNGEETPPSGDK
jgi:hypothetical protein